MQEENSTNNMDMRNIYHCIYPIPFMPRFVSLANAYIPYQQHAKSFELSDALMKGILFPELYQPYETKRDGGITNE